MTEQTDKWGGGKREYAWTILNNVCRYSALKQVEHNSPFLKCRLSLSEVTFFHSTENGGKNGDNATSAR